MTQANAPKQKKIIAAFQKVVFPELHHLPVTAKIDTGAYTGAIHCSKIEEHDIDGGKYLTFIPLGSTEAIQKDEFIIKYVRSSNGKREKRYFITTEVDIADNSYIITLSLANRADMKWPVLIGRKFLRENRFVVDPSLSREYDRADGKIK